MNNNYTLFLYEDTDNERKWYFVYKIYKWDITSQNNQKIIYKWNVKIKINNINEDYIFLEENNNWFYTKINSFFNKEIKNWNLNFNNKKEIEDFLLEQVINNWLYTKDRSIFIFITQLILLTIMSIFGIIIILNNIK